MLFSILSPLFGLAEKFKVIVREYCKNIIKNYTKNTLIKHFCRTNIRQYKKIYTKVDKQNISNPFHFLSPFHETYIFELLKSEWKSQRCLMQFF